MKEYDYTDPVLEEIWAVRDRLAAEVGYDLESWGGSTRSTRSSMRTS